MKKFLTLILLLVVGLTFAGCENSKNTMASNLENNVNRLTVLLKKSNEISEQDILLKEFYNTNNYVTPTTNPVSTKNTLSRKKTINENESIKINNIPRPKAEELKNGIVRLTNSSYIPRRLSSCDNDNLMNYLSMVEDLYLIMNDAVCANEDCNNAKSDILSYCKLITSLSKQLKNDNINLDDNQINACNDLIGQLNKDCNSLNETKNDVKNNCSACQTTNLNPNVNIQQISAKYVKLINSLEERTTIYNNILNTLRQLDCTITGKCTNDICTDDNCNIIKPTPENMPAKINIKNENNNIKNNEKITEDNKINQEIKNDKKIEKKPENIKNIDTFKENKKEIDNEKNIENNENIKPVENPMVPYVPNGYGYQNGMMPNGMYGGYGYGIHSIENGITNPYRNTDTYKLPTINEVRRGYNYNGVAFIMPLQEETRKNFKAFS